MPGLPPESTPMFAIYIHIYTYIYIFYFLLYIYIYLYLLHTYLCTDIIFTMKEKDNKVIKSVNNWVYMCNVFPFKL